MARSAVPDRPARLRRHRQVAGELAFNFYGVLAVPLIRDSFVDGRRGGASSGDWPWCW